MSDLLDHYRAKFPGTDPMMLLRSLTYFDDAEGDENPRTLEKLTWEAAKARIRVAVGEFLR